MRSNVPVSIKWLAVVGYTALAILLLAGGFYFAPIAGTAAAIGMDAIVQRFGPLAGGAALIGIVVVGYTLGFASLRRDERREYERTHTITVEKRRPTPLWVKVALWGQATLLILAFAAIAAGGFR